MSSTEGYSIGAGDAGTANKFSPNSGSGSSELEISMIYNVSME